MMDPIKEAGETGRTYIKGLSGQPVLLVQSLIIAGVVFILYAQGSKSFNEREVLLKSVFEAQASVRDILSKCVVPNGRQSSLRIIESAPLVPLPIPFPGQKEP